MDSADIAAIKFLAAPLPILLSIALAAFGVFCAQVYAYWLTFVRDARSMKMFVVCLWILECLHSASVIHMMYWYFITNLGNPEALLYIVWSIAVSIALEISVIALTQGFYVYRLWILSRRNLVVVGVPSVLLLGRAGLAFVNVYLLCTIPTWVEFHTQRTERVIMNLGLSFGAVDDVLLTTLLIHYLHKHKTAFRSTNHLIEKLIFYTINTGALTTVVSVTILMLYNFLPTSLAFGGLLQIISKLYANSALAMLNARHTLQEEYMVTSDGGVVLSTPVVLENSHVSRVTRRISPSASMGGADGLRLDVYKSVQTDSESFSFHMSSHSPSIVSDL